MTEGDRRGQPQDFRTGENDVPEEDTAEFRQQVDLGLTMAMEIMDANTPMGADYSLALLGMERDELAALTRTQRHVIRQATLDAVGLSDEQLSEAAVREYSLAQSDKPGATERVAVTVYGTSLDNTYLHIQRHPDSSEELFIEREEDKVAEGLGRVNLTNNELEGKSCLEVTGGGVEPLLPRAVAEAGLTTTTTAVLEDVPVDFMPQQYNESDQTYQARRQHAATIQEEYDLAIDPGAFNNIVWEDTTYARLLYTLQTLRTGGELRSAYPQRRMQGLSSFLTYARQREMLDPQVVAAADLSLKKAKTQAKRVGDKRFAEIIASENDTDWTRIFNSLNREQQEKIMGLVAGDIQGRMQREGHTISVGFVDQEDTEGAEYRPMMVIKKLDHSAPPEI